MDSMFPRMEGQIDDVASAADRLADVCLVLESRLSDAELTLIMVRREFATWVLRSLEASESRETSNLGIVNTEVLALVRQYSNHAMGQCSGCLRMAPLTDGGLCAWGCPPRSPQPTVP